MEVPPRLRQRRGAIHAGDAAFWAVYENAGAWATLTLAYALMAADFFRDWVEEVAKEPMEVPVVPRNLGLAGIELSWAHTGITLTFHRWSTLPTSRGRSYSVSSTAKKRSCMEVSP